MIFIDCLLINYPALKGVKGKGVDMIINFALPEFLEWEKAGTVDVPKETDLLAATMPKIFRGLGIEGSLMTYCGSTIEPICPTRVRWYIQLKTRREFALLPLVMERAAKAEVVVSSYKHNTPETKEFWRELAEAQMWYQAIPQE